MVTRVDGGSRGGRGELFDVETEHQPEEAVDPSVGQGDSGGRCGIWRHRVEGRSSGGSTQFLEAATGCWHPRNAS